MSGQIPEVELVFDEPVQRKKAPKHLADFSPTERKAFAKELGFEPFRATQVATHYFSHLSSNPEEWTDIPAAERQLIADALTPQMIKLVTTRTTDNGMTRKDLWKLHDGVLVESVLMRYADPRDSLYIFSSWLWNELPVLCNRSSRPNTKLICR